MHTVTWSKSSLVQRNRRPHFPFHFSRIRSDCGCRDWWWIAGSVVISFAAAKLYFICRVIAISDQMRQINIYSFLFHSLSRPASLPLSSILHFRLEVVRINVCSYVQMLSFFFSSFIFGLFLLFFATSNPLT